MAVCIFILYFGKTAFKMLIEDKDLKISVIIPVYNAERYLNRCIEAVLAQTHKDLEIILINDGSTDASGEIIHSFKDERIIMIEKKNGGVSAARNDGLKKASGSRIVFVDADDYPDPEYIGKMSAAMDRNECGMAVCGFRCRDMEGHVTGGFPNQREALCLRGNGYLSREEVVAGIMLHESIASCLWNKMFKAELLSGMWFDETIAIGEDLLFLIEYVGRCDAFYLVCEPLYNYLINPTGAMKTITEQASFDPKWLSEWDSIRRAEEYCPVTDQMISDVFEYKKMLIANKILTKAARCGFRGTECDEMKAFIKKNRIRAIRNPYLNARVKVKAFSY